MMIDETIVYVVDDDSGMRNSMCFVLSKLGIASVACASGTELLESIDQTKPCCLVVDFQMPEMTGLSLIKEIRNLFGMVPFVLISGHGSVPMAVEAMQLGAVTVLEKPFHHEDFLNAVRTMLALISRKKVLAMSQNQMGDRIQLLTPRQREIASLVVEGRLTKQIAKELGISPKTVEVHRSHITKKLGVESVAQLVKMFLASQAKAG